MHTLTTDDWLALTRIWTGLSQLPASALDAPAVAVLESLGALVGAPQGYAFFARRAEDVPAADPFRGWQPFAIVAHGERLRPMVEVARRWLRDAPERMIDPLSEAAVAFAGELRCHRRGDLVSDAVWETTPSARMMAALGVTDQLIAARPVAEALEIYFTFHRLDGRFSERDRDLVRAALEGLDPLCARYARGLGYLPGTAKLAPRERDVLSHLLRGATERQIAEALGLTLGSTHQYVVSIYRKLQVSGRGELTALWLEGDPA